MKRFQTVPPKPADADMPLSEIEAEALLIWAERDRRVAALTLRQAAARTTSPSDRLAYSLDEWFVRHPDVPLSTDADYPDFHPGDGA